MELGYWLPPYFLKEKSNHKSLEEVVMNKWNPYLYYVVVQLLTQVSEVKVEAVLWFQQLSLLFEAAGFVRTPTTNPSKDPREPI